MEISKFIWHTHRIIRYNNFDTLDWAMLHNQSSKHSRLYLIVACILALFTIAANDDTGTITSLTAAGGTEPNQIITITASVLTAGKVNLSNFYFVITAFDGTVVDTHSYEVPTLQENQAISYSWTSSNSGYPVRGDYTVSLCWSPGKNATNCNIDYRITTFYAADTLGLFLTIVLVVLVGGWFWRVRHEILVR